MPEGLLTPELQAFYNPEDSIQAAGHDIYIADHEHLGTYAGRILEPGMSETYPVEDLYGADALAQAHTRIAA